MLAMAPPGAGRRGAAGQPSRTEPGKHDTHCTETPAGALPALRRGLRPPPAIWRPRTFGALPDTRVQPRRAFTQNRGTAVRFPPEPLTATPWWSSSLVRRGFFSRGPGSGVVASGGVRSRCDRVAVERRGRRHRCCLGAMDVVLSVFGSRWLSWSRCQGTGSVTTIAGATRRTRHRSERTTRCVTPALR
jgi:hypothetical protein